MSFWSSVWCCWIISTLWYCQKKSIKMFSKSFIQWWLNDCLNFFSFRPNNIRDLWDQFLRLKPETETEQVQSQQARPMTRLKRYSLNKRDRDSYSWIFETETETKTRKMCIFETKIEAETRKMVETESLTDLWSISVGIKDRYCNS